MNLERTTIMKALTTLVIEETLLGIGKPVFENVANSLYKKYHCYIPDCYEHPEYLSDILRSVFGNSHGAVVKSIKEKLANNLDDSGIQVLIKTIV